jgi:signal transduction histidine kinase
MKEEQMATLTICVISSDEALLELCRSVVASMITVTAELLCVTAGPPPEADLYILDFDPGEPVYADESRDLRTLIVVDRKDVVPFRRAMPMAAASIFLKPVNRIILESFVHNTAVRRFSEPFPTGASDQALRLDRDELLQRLFEVNLRLQEYDQDRTNFLARTLHEFRAPLTALSGYCGLLVKQQVGPVVGEQLDILLRMNNSINRLNRMASALFQLSVGSRFENASDIRPGNIEAIVEQAVVEMSAFLKEKNIAVTVQFDAPGQPLCFDGAQIEQVVINLLDNACKYSPRNSLVTIRGYANTLSSLSGPISPVGGPMYHLEVSDSGAGIPADRLESVFEEFTSYGGSGDRSGAGLGLAICKTLIHQHKGRIRAASNGYGVTFTVALPLGLNPTTRASSDSLAENSQDAGSVGLRFDAVAVN